MSAASAVHSAADLQAWVGRVETAFDTVTPQLAQRLAATVDSPRGNLAKGDILPQGWYSVLFPRVAQRSQIGADGHPALGDFLPPVPLPKRMFAGKRIRFAVPIRVGDELERVSEIASITPKQGGSGPLVFVTLRHTLRNGVGVVVVEEQDVVYRSAARTGSKPAAPDTAASFPARHVSPEIVADTVMLFRYSALCFNGHRIHYDQPYATQVEGYPALVVNGGLSTLCAIEHLHDAWGGVLDTLATRNVAPLFQGEAFRVESAAGAAADTADFRVVTTAGKVVVAGSAAFRPGAAR